MTSTFYGIQHDFEPNNINPKNHIGFSAKTDVIALTLRITSISNFKKYFAVQ